MSTEQWGQQIIEMELNRQVILHDDGSQPSMYDLRVGAAQAPDVAIECVGAVDADRTETWNVGPGKGPLQLALRGDWLITIARNTRISTLRKRIESVLRDLEERDVRRVSTVYPSGRNYSRPHQQLESLGIRHASLIRMPGEGRVHWTMEGAAALSTRPAVPYHDGSRNSSAIRNGKTCSLSFVGVVHRSAGCSCPSRWAALRGR